MGNFDWSLNCGMEAMDYLLRMQMNIESLKPLLQPLGFGFEVELGTRDWWIGGYSSIHYQRPRFNRGLSAEWVPVDEATFKILVREGADAGRATIFQTEWAFVEYVSHYGWNIGSLHAAIAFDLTPRGEYKVRDRMFNSHLWFDEGGFGDVPADSYSSAFDHRLSILEYRVAPDPPDWRTEFTELLDVGLAEMEEGNDPHLPGPHGHLAVGLPGLKYTAMVFDHFAPRFSTDEHVKSLLGVRLVDGVQTVMGERVRLLRACREFTTEQGTAQAMSRFPALDYHMTEGLHSWRRLGRVLAREARSPEPDLPRVGGAFLDTFEHESRLVTSLKEWRRVL